MNHFVTSFGQKIRQNYSLFQMALRIYFQSYIYVTPLGFRTSGPDSVGKERPSKEGSGSSFATEKKFHFYLTHKDNRY